MRTPKILIVESAGFPPEAASLLRQAGDVVLADLDRSGLESAVADAGVLWVRLRHRVDVRLLALAPSLQVVATPTTGVTHVDVDALERHRVELLCLRGETEFLKDIRGTAEHTLGLMLALLRHIPDAVAHVREGAWIRDRFQGRELFGKTVGIVGYGRLGRIVARYLRAFDCKVLACDPRSVAVEQGVTLVPLQELLGASDIVTLHAALGLENRGFFGSREFQAMKPGSCFINTARGELIDESALLDTLRTGHLAGAALDVLVDERPAGMAHHPLVEYARIHPNLIVTPHIGGCTVESMPKTELFLARKLFHHLRSKAVPPEMTAVQPA